MGRAAKLSPSSIQRMTLDHLALELTPRLDVLQLLLNLNCVVLMPTKMSIDNFRAMATISTTRCLVSLSIWRNHLGQDYFNRNKISLYEETSVHVTHQVQASDP